MICTDDPLLEFDREQQKRLKKLPVCCYCNDPIKDDFCYEINGDYYKAVDDIVC